MTTLAALTVRDSVAAACSVTGLFATTTTSILFPIAVHLQTKKLPRLKQLLWGAVFAFATLFALAGTVATVREEMQT